MTSEDAVLGVVRDAVREAAPTFHGDDQAPLIRERVLDSLALLSVVSRLEERLGVVIGDTELLPRNFASVAAIREFLATKGC